MTYLGCSVLGGIAGCLLAARDGRNWRTLPVSGWLSLAVLVNVILPLVAGPPEAMSLAGLDYSRATFYLSVCIIAVGLGVSIVVVMAWPRRRPSKRVVCRSNYLTLLALYGAACAVLRLLLLARFGLGRHADPGRPFPLSGALVLGSQYGLRTCGVLLLASRRSNRELGWLGGGLLLLNEGVAAATGSRGGPVAFVVLAGGAWLAGKQGVRFGRALLASAIVLVVLLAALSTVIRVRDASDGRTAGQFLAERTSSAAFLAPVVGSGASLEVADATLNYTEAVSQRVYGRSTDAPNGFAITIWGLGWLTFRWPGVLLVGISIGIAVRSAEGMIAATGAEVRAAVSCLVGFWVYNLMQEGTLVLGVKSLMFILLPLLLVMYPSRVNP